MATRKKYTVITFKINSTVNPHLFVVDTMKEKNWELKIITDLPDGSILITVVLRQELVQQSSTEILNKMYENADNLQKIAIADTLSNLQILPQKFNNSVELETLINYIDSRANYLKSYKTGCGLPFNERIDSLTAFITFVSDDPIIATEEIYTRGKYPRYLLTLARHSSTAKKIMKHLGLRAKQINTNTVEVSETVYHNLLTCADMIMVDKMHFK